MKWGIAGALATFLVAAASSACGQAAPPKADPEAPPASRPSMPRPRGNPSPVKPAPGQEPKIVFETDYHDFGDVDEGPERYARFPFRNEGKGDLVILGEVKHCGCSDTWYEVGGKLYSWGDPIPPGASGAVHFVFKTAGFSNDKPSQVDVLTNDPTRPPAVIGGNASIPFGATPVRVHANIRRLFEYVPSAAITLGTISNREPTERTVRLKSPHGRPFEVVALEPSNDPLLQARARCENAERTSWAIEITIPAGLTPQNLTKAILVKTKPEVPNAAIYVLGAVRGAIEMEPQGFVNFSTIARRTASMRQVTLRNRDGEAPLKVGAIEIVDTQGKPSPFAAHLRVTTIETVPGAEARLSIEVLESMPPGPGSARLRFDTGVPRGPESLVVSVAWLVR